jgi:hypothetical protein
MDETERRRRQEEADRYRDSIKYEGRLTAFLDILGWRSAIDQTRRDVELVKTLGVALSALSRHADVTESLEAKRRSMGLPVDRLDSQATQFSDSIVYSIMAESHDWEAQLALIAQLSVITEELRDAGLILRGAVTWGPLVHKAKVVFGPALVSAYDLERVNPWPRIILDASLSKLWSPGIGVTLPDDPKTFDFVMQHWRTDSDGKVFLDFLKPRLWMARIPPDCVSQHLEKYRSLIVTNLANHQQPSQRSPKASLACTVFQSND